MFNFLSINIYSYSNTNYSLILEKIDLLLRISIAIIFKPSDTKLLVPLLNIRPFLI